MKTLLVSAVLFTATMAFAADEPATKGDAKETMKARMLEDAKKRAAEAAAKPTAATVATKKEKDRNPLAATPGTVVTAVEKPAEKTPATKAAEAKAAAEPASVLPKVEVKKARITVLDVQLQQQEKEIAREEKLTKPTELDKALNDSKVAKSLSILGGQSADYRAGLAKERVGLMQEESDLIEAIAHAKTKEERAELQRELEALRTYRRDLEKSRR